MLPLLLSLLPALLSFFFMGVGSGLLNTCTSLRLEYEGCTTETIGFVSSSLYLGILISSLYIDRWIIKLGHLRALATFVLLLGILVIVQLSYVDPILWSLIRLFAGMAIAGVWIAIESLLLLQTPISLKGTAISLYLTVNYIALSSGQFLTRFVDPATSTPFWITACLMLLALCALQLRTPRLPPIEKPMRMGLLTLYQLSPLGFFGGIVSGMVLAAIYSMMPIYGRQIGLTVPEIGTFMGVLIFGGLVSQWPIGALGDQGKRRLLLFCSSLMCMLLGGVIPLIASSLLLLLPCSFLFGGFAFVLYPLSITYVCEQVPKEQIVAATGGFIFSYAIGSILGPLFASMAITWFDASGLWHFLALITCFLGLGAVVRIPTKSSTSHESNENEPSH